MGVCRAKLEEVLKKKAEAKGGKKKKDKLGVEAAKKAIEEREAKNKKKNQMFDL